VSEKICGLILDDFEQKEPKKIVFFLKAKGIQKGKITSGPNFSA
jgi:hypothetical protein